jgi:hypothetical protein
MKILKQGTIPVPPVYYFQGECVKCGCIVECTETEIQSIAERHPGGRTEYSVICPFESDTANGGKFKCHTKIILREVPKRGTNIPTRSVTLSETEWKVMDHFLNDLSDHQSNAGCNDLPRELVDLIPHEDGQKMAEEYAKFNNPEEPEGPRWPISDFCLVSLLQHKIKKQTP